jgi:hypothetical protein
MRLSLRRHDRTLAWSQLPQAINDKVHEVYISPINGSRFWGLRDYSVTSLLTSPLALDLELSNCQMDKLRSIYMPIAQQKNKLMMRLRQPSHLKEGEERSIRAEQARLFSELNETMAGVLNAGNAPSNASST